MNASELGGVDLRKLSDQQKSHLKEFKILIADESHLKDPNDQFLLYWLLACDFDMTEARKRLLKCLEWRHENRIDFIQQEFQYPDVILKYMPMRVIGHDKLRNPVVLGRFGKMDTNGLIKSIGMESYQKSYIKTAEDIFSDVYKNNTEGCRLSNRHTLLQCTWIVDMEGYSASQLAYKPTLDATISWVKVSEAYYPENIRRVIIINASKVFIIGYALLKPFMSKKNRNKMRIFNNDSEVWKKVLLAEIDADQLPACYGGTMIDPDGNPNCITKCPMGGPVPKSYYLENTTAD